MLVNDDFGGLYIPIQGPESGLKGVNLLLVEPKTGANLICSVVLLFLTLFKALYLPGPGVFVYSFVGGNLEAFPNAPPFTPS